MRRLFLKLTTIFLFFASVCAAQGVPAVRLRTGDVAVPALSDVLLDSLNRQLPRTNGRAYVLLQFGRIPDADARKWLQSQGIELEQYLPELAYTATVNGALSRVALQQGGVRGIWAFRPEQKIDPLLLQPQLPVWAIQSAGTVNLLVRVTDGSSVGNAVAALNAAGFRVTGMEWSAWRVLGLQVSLQRLRELAALPFIGFVQAEPPAAQPLNNNVRSAARANVLNATAGRNLNGDSLVLGIGDDADIQSHVDFTGRLIAKTYSSFSFHGVHTSGTMAGAGIVNELYRGMAPKATIISQISTGILNNAATYYADNGMRLTNNSYGNIVACDYHGTYDVYAQLIDQQAMDLPGLLHVFAAGNSGNSTCSPFSQRYHTVLGGWQSAKNVISVGATTDSGAVSTFSSRGPVRDGRIKPEVMAQGQAVMSAGYGGTYGSTYYSNQGTSMAAPAVTGGLALLLQRYKQLHSGSNPDGALLKALLCNGASDKGTTGPDFNYGYGWMNLLRSVDMMEQARYYSASATQGSQQDQIITVAANTAQLKVLLYWHDPAASLLAAKTLVNDLDLEVIDLSNNVQLPYRLDTAGGTLGQAAFRSADHLNNIEQVVIDSPPAGSYTIRVKGTAITQNGSQSYYVAYDPIPVSLQLTNPVGGEAWVPGEVMRLHWEAYGNAASTYALDYSTDNGSNWTSIATGISADSRSYSWTVPSVPTATALVRLTQGGTGTTSTSSTFVILGQPVITLASSTNQCEGYINFSWTAVSSATDYEVMLLQGSEMQSYATTTGTSYTFEGMDKSKKYWFAVRARISGAAGRRSLAAAYTPNTGSCIGTVSDGDLKLSAIISPYTGRLNTSSALTASNPIKVEIRNLDDADITGFQVSYRINGGAWVTENVSGTITAQGYYTHTFLTTANFSAPGTYTVEAMVVNNATDAHTSNNSAQVTVRQLSNSPLTLPFTDNLEGLTEVIYATDTTGLYGDDRFDYVHGTTYARLRTRVNTGFPRSGTKALTLDQSMDNPGGTQYLVATFNLSAFTAATNDIRLDFAYMSHGSESNTNHKVWIRGNDAAAWIAAYDLFPNSADNGVYAQSSSIELSRLLNAAGQNFSSSFQVRWGQNGSYPATEPAYLNGYSIDDIRLYEAQKDLQVKSILAPLESNCALSASTQVRVHVRNSALSTQTSIPVQYRVDGGSWVSETIASMAAATEVDYTFATQANLSALGAHTVEVRVQQPGDNVDYNDTLSVALVNSPVISSFPYIEGFETGTGYWYAGGKNSSWQWGTPGAQLISRAAGGTKAWKTSLTGNYNDKELSYLYSPCFNLQGLSNPTLSFALALDLEDCTPYVCDATWVEYSTDGITWTKLGVNGSGTNWYNRGSGLDVWSRQSYMTWRVASIPLPATGSAQLRLRFVMSSDDGVSRQGVAIDNIHIFDNTAMFTGPTGTPVTKPVSGSSWVHFSDGSGKLLASINPNGQDLGATSVQAYVDTSTVHYTASQYYLGRNYVIKPASQPASPVTVRLYFSEREAEQVLNATSCAACSRPATAFDFGVSKFSARNLADEDNSLLNNTSGSWLFLGSSDRTIVPYDKGYYAEFSVASFSEFWFNSGGVNNNQPLPVRFVSFTARRNEAAALLNWEVATEVDVAQYEVEVAAGEEALQRGDFVHIGNVAALGNTSTGHSYRYSDDRPGKSGTYYYRLRVRNRDGSFQLSAVRPVTFNELFAWTVYPNPSAGLFYLSYRAAEGAPVQFRLYDAQGSLLRQWSRIATGFVEKLQVDLLGKGYAAGMYLLRAETGGSEQSFRLFRK
jgi:hypothetical protein